jgi:hypothetical protein
MADPRFVRLGGMNTLEEMKIAIRDLETALSALMEVAATNAEDAPASVKALVRLTDGSYQLWDVVSTGGCTITKNAALKRIEISVP